MQHYDDTDIASELESHKHILARVADYFLPDLKLTRLHY